MTVRFDTHNSSYEIDGLAVRRLRGVDDPTPRQGTDSEWKQALVVWPTPITLGLPVMFVWRVDEGDGVKVLRTTTTSPVVAITRTEIRHEG